jgi:hypothetical protein
MKSVLLYVNTIQALMSIYQAALDLTCALNGISIACAPTP